MWARGLRSGAAGARREALRGEVARRGGVEGRGYCTNTETDTDGMPSKLPERALVLSPSAAEALKSKLPLIRPVARVQPETEPMEPLQPEVDPNDISVSVKEPFRTA